LKSEAHTAWLFIGLGFPAPRAAAANGKTHNVDLTSVIRDFAFYTDQWEARHGGMDMQIDHVTRAQIPEWVLEAVESSAGDSKHLRKQASTEKLSKKNKRHIGDCTGVAHGALSASSAPGNSAKKSKGT
jgi:poly(A) polymerase Pap1